MGKQSREKRERRDGMSSVEKAVIPNAKTGLEKACLFIIQWGTYLVLFTPLIISIDFFFPFVAPKTIFFRILVEILLVAYLFLLISNTKRYRPRVNALTITISLFVGIFILASFTGVNLTRSFWSTYERMTGILTMAHLFAFFLILGSVFKRRRDWERILGVSIIVGVILSLYILFGNQISTRGGGTIGNTSFMAAYLLFPVFFAISLFLAKRGWWMLFSGASLCAMIPVLLTSTARGAIMSFFAGLFLLGLGYLIFSRKKLLKRMALAVVLALILFGLFAAIIQPSFVKDRVDTTATEMKSRLVVWEKGLKGFQEKPILGWGPENFNNVFLKYYNPCMSMPECGTEIWFDRVHNIVFDTLVTTGLLGLLAYLSIFGAAIYGLWRAASRVIELRNVFIPLGLVVVLLVYFAQNLLVFDMINTYLMFFLCLGFTYFLTQKQETEEETKPISVNLVIGAIIIVAMIFVFWVGNVQPLMANRNIINVVQSSEVEEASSFFKKSLYTWMDKYETREQFAQKMVKSPYQSISGEYEESFREAFILAETEMEKSIEQNSLDFRPHLFLGQLYIHSYRFTQENDKLVRAEQILEKAIELSPTNQQAYWNLAEVKLIMGEIGEVLSLLQKSVDIEPRLGYSHWYLAMAHSIAGQYQLAKESITNAELADYPYRWWDNMGDIKRIISFYSTLGDDAGLVSLYLRAIELDSNDAELWASLAASYANLGQFDKAEEAAKKVIEINPEMAPSVEQFLIELP